MENKRKRKAMKIQNTMLSTKNDLPELNNDCLLYIFSFLPIMERIRIQRVCKRWREIGNLPWQDMKRLDFTGCPAIWSTTGSRGFSLSKKILQRVFKLCGVFLREIHISLEKHLRFGEITEELERVFVVLLREYCPNVQVLNLQYVKSHCRILEYFTEYFNGITDFSIESDQDTVCSDQGTVAQDFFFRDHHALARFFRRNGNLRSVRLCSVTLLGRCLRYLPFQIIEEITIDRSYIKEIELDVVSKVKLSNLKTLTFTYNHCENMNGVLEFITAQSNLKNLQLASHSEEKLILKSTTKLDHFETVDLRGRILSNDLLMFVSKNYTNLIRVSLICADENVTNVSLIQLLSLPNLQYVELLHMLMISDNGLLTEMPKLKSFECVLCPLLQNNGFRAMLESSKSIETLQVSACENVSAAKLITDAVQMTKNRNSNFKLELYVNEHYYIINNSRKHRIKQIY